MGPPGLGRFVARRLALSVPVVVLASVVTFGLVAASGDPLIELRTNAHISKDTIRDRERALHLDRAIPVRYVIWAGAALRGDMGRTIDDSEDVGAVLWRASGVTARLVGPAMVVALVLALVVGVVSAARRGSWFDHLGTLSAFLLIALPAFWLGWLLREVTVHLNGAIGAHVLFFTGERSTVSPGGALAAASDRLRHLVLPAMTLGLVVMAPWSRFLRSSMLDSLGADYVRTARAKGLPEWRVVGHHALRTSLVPLTTIVALTSAGLVGGAVVVEQVFSWPGLGQVLLRGLQGQDVNLVAGWLLMASLFVIGLNLAADIACAVLDPRTRRG